MILCIIRILQRWGDTYTYTAVSSLASTPNNIKNISQLIRQSGNGMIRAITLFAFVISGTAAGSCPAVDSVNSFIGTGGIGFGYGGVNPAAQTPNGPMRLGPDTTNTMANVGYRHFSGYNYLDDQIRAFSHTHLVGAGLNDLGNFGIMPVRVHGERGGDDETDLMRAWMGLDNVRDELEQNTRVWWSMFNKSTENASPGQYGVFLERPSVQASLLATGRSTAVHKYVFSPTADANAVFEPAVVLDVCHASHLSDGLLRDQKCDIASLDIGDDLNSFTATVFFSGKFWMYLYGQFESAGMSPKKWITCSNGDGRLGCSSSIRSASTENHFLFSRVSFGPQSSNSPVSVELRVALSFISGEQAKKNFGAIDNSMSFDDLAVATKQVWCNALSFMEIKPLEGDAEILPILMSASYRALMTPTDYTEEGDVYLGLDKNVHNAVTERSTMYPDSSATNGKVMRFYSDFSFWDTFRTLHPWLLLIDESLSVGILRSVSEMTQQQGGFPRWVLANVDISCMIGLHGGAAALEGALVGLGDEFDVRGIQQMLLSQATQVRFCYSKPPAALTFVDIGFLFI